MTHNLHILAEIIRNDPAFSSKKDIAESTKMLGLDAASLGNPGDDCAVLKQGDDTLLYAMEGFINDFVEADPWFAGWCGVMVNLSDITAMGGRATAITNAIWTTSPEKAKAVLEGMKAASETYQVPIVGGHTNLQSRQNQLAVSIIGKAEKLITSFDAQPGDKLVSAIDLRGRYRPPFNNFQAALKAPAERLRGDLGVLPYLAEKGYTKAGKDISQGGIPGTTLMLAECSNCSIKLHLDKIKCPPETPLKRWLMSFPSYGYLLAVKPENLSAVLGAFHQRDIWADAIGDIEEGSSLHLCHAKQEALLWDYQKAAYLDLSGKEKAHA